MAALLAKGSNITIYAGAGCAAAHNEIVQLAKLLHAPVAHTSRGKDALEYDNPNNVGMTGILGFESGYHAILNCDTLVLLGTNFAWSQFYPKNTVIIQVDLDPMRIGQRHPVDLGVVGDIKDTLQALLPRISQRTSSSFRDAYVQRHEKAMKAQAARAAPGRHGLIYGQYLTSIINRKAAADTLFAADDGTCGVWMLRVIEANGKRRMFASLLHGTMASGLGTAIGLQTCQPSRQVVCMAGDGGLTMLLGDLITVVSEKLPIKIAVYDNGKLGFVELEQKSEGLLPAYTDLKNPDFGKVAETMGLWGHTVTDAAELESAVDEWLAVCGPALLNVKVAPMELVLPPFVTSGAAYGLALYSVRAVLHGQSGDVFEMISENIPK
jgi:pyruvate dehydrogenase (quinone)